MDYLSLWINRLRTNLGDDPQHPTIVLGDFDSGFQLVQ
jgi:hypothetical protein